MEQTKFNIKIFYGKKPVKEFQEQTIDETARVLYTYGKKDVDKEKLAQVKDASYKGDENTRLQVTKVKTIE